MDSMTQKYTESTTMDKRVAKKTWTTQRIVLAAGGVAFIAFVLYIFVFSDQRSRMNVETNKITIAAVAKGEFQEFIVQTGNVLPIQTVYIDAIEGGNIKKIIRESGAIVEKGDTLFALTNSSLQLSVMTQEAQLYEQVNTVRNTRLNIEQNDLRLRQNIAEIDYQIHLLKPQYERYKKLLESKAISQREFEEVKENYDYQIKRRKFTYASYRSDSISRIQQLHHLNLSESRMLGSLDAVGQILDNLYVKAPAKGQFAAPELQLGQSINRGQRLGQVDVLDKFKIRVRIDELYLPRISVGQNGSCEFNGKRYALQVSKIFPTITDGRFETDMEFIEESPTGIKRGLSMRVQVELSNAAQAVLLPVGGFYKETGGNWVYVLDADGKRAAKREIRLGRKNTDHFEVLEGLKAGEKVITSSYEYFGTNEVLVLNED